MKHLMLLVLLVGCSLTSFSQKRAKEQASPERVVKNIAPHYPADKSEASMAAWIKSYPEEAQRYQEEVSQRLNTSNYSELSATETKEYGEAKQELKVINNIQYRENTATETKSEN